MNQRFCTGCGATLPEGSSFCGVCGTPAPAAGSAQPAVAPPGQMPAGPTHVASPAYVPPPMALPPLATPGHVQPVGGPAGSKAWQKWVFGAVGAVAILTGLRQMGIIGGSSRSAAESAIVGRWAPDSTCASITTLAADGIYRAPDGVTTARWTLQGDRFTLTNTRGTVAARLVARSSNSFTLLWDDGTRDTQVRC